MHLLVPTTDLTNEYDPALTCSFAGLVQIGARCAVVGTEHQHLGQPHVGCRTLSVPDEPAQGCGDGRPALRGSAEAAVQHEPAAIDRRHRRQPGGVRKPTVAAQLRWPQTAVVRADRRPTTQPRSGRTTRMRTRATLIKFGDLRGRDGDADRLPVLHLRPVPDGFDDRVFGGVHRRVASQAGAVGAGRRDPGGHGQ